MPTPEGLLRGLTFGGARACHTMWSGCLISGMRVIRRGLFLFFLPISMFSQQLISFHCLFIGILLVLECLRRTLWIFGHLRILSNWPV